MEPILAEIKYFPFDFSPENYAECNGQLVSISQYLTLFAIIGTKFGGDGVTTFGLPIIPGFNGVKAFIALKGNFPEFLWG